MDFVKYLQFLEKGRIIMKNRTTALDSALDTAFLEDKRKWKKGTWNSAL